MHELLSRLLILDLINKLFFYFLYPKKRQCFRLRQLFCRPGNMHEQTVRTRTMCKSSKLDDSALRLRQMLLYFLLITKVVWEPLCVTVQAVSHQYTLQGFLHLLQQHKGKSYQCEFKLEKLYLVLIHNAEISINGDSVML